MVRLPVRALHRKLLRDAWRLRGQLTSITSVVFCGIVTVVAMRSVYESLVASRDAYYARYHFADVFAAAKRAPEALAGRIAAIPGISTIETRISVSANLDVPGLDEPAHGQLLSLPRGGPTLNRLHLVAGRLPAAGRGAEAVASSAFAAANRLALGARIGAVINGRWERLVIVGIGMSPEFVYELGPGQLFPDARRYGVFWLDRAALAPPTAMEGAFNDVVVSLARGASAPAVIAELDRVLEPYGGWGAYARDDQLSNRLLREELNQNRVTGTMIPAIFTLVAAFLLNIVMVRLVHTQREQIALLKAFGYTNGEVGTHYLLLALVPVVLGTALGVLGGIWLGKLLLGVYAIYFQFPSLDFAVNVPLLSAAVVVSVGAATAGALSAVRGAVRLPPAEAMRPPTPPLARRGPIERLGLGRLLSTVGRVVLRSLERQPVRTALSAAAVGCAVSILIVGSFMWDAVGFMTDLQFRSVQREDVMVTFAAARPVAARHDLAAIPGVSAVETFRAVPVRLRAAHRSEQTSLMGVERGAALRRIIGSDREPREPPGTGALVSAALADRLGVGLGDRLTAEVLEGDRRTLDLAVTGIVDELFGMAAYVELGELARLLGGAPAISGAFLRVDAPATASVNEILKETPAISAVATRRTTLANFEQLLAQNLSISMTLLIVFAGVIALGVVYNGARISLSERGRELASLRVLGFTRREVASVVFGEQAMVTLLGLPVGALLGGLFAWWVVSSMSAQGYRVPLVIGASTYAFSLLVLSGAMLVAGVLVRRRISRMDLIEVLKTRE